MNALTFVREALVDSAVAKFSASSISEKLIADAGVDGEAVQVAELSLALSGEIRHADEVAFMLNEVLNEYVQSELDDLSLVSGVAASWLYLDCVELGYGDSEFVFWKVLRIVCAGQGRLQMEAASQLVRRVTL